MQHDKLKFLLVDDESITLELLRYMLAEEFECECVTFASAKVALTHLNSTGFDKFDLIISDWEMPGINGIEFLQQIREKDNITPFLLLTANATKELVMQAAESKATGFIAKPFRNLDLISKVKKVLNSVELSS